MPYFVFHLAIGWGLKEGYVHTLITCLLLGEDSNWDHAVDCTVSSGDSYVPWFGGIILHHSE
jgi:hypothetical protein